MKTPAFLLSCMLCLSSLSADAAHENTLPMDVSQKSKPATLKIVLEKLSPDVLLEVKGRYQIYHPHSNLLIESGILGKRSKIKMSNEGLKWGELFPGTFELRIVPGDSQSSILVNGIQYKGCVEIYGMAGKISVINEVDIENYLKAYLSHECASLPEELLDVAAVVARTNFYYLANKNKDAAWHLDAQKVHYSGNELVSKNKYVENAVEKTKHMIMVYQNQPFPATWTKDCAGKTASYSSIFRKGGQTPPGVEALPSGFHRMKNTWTFSVSKEKMGHIANLDNIAKIDLFNADHTGKVYAVRFSNGEDTANLDFFSLQRALGKELLKSNDFTIQASENEFTFTGFGEGLGVGLCLSSAEILLKRKENPRKIVKTFFPGVQLVYMRTLDAKEPVNEDNNSAAWQ